MSYLKFAADRPDDLAVDDLERRRSWSELADRVTRMAHLIRDVHGIEPGGHVSVLMNNRVEFVEAMLGGQLAGVWVTPVNWHLTAAEVGYIVEDSASRLVITDPEYAPTAREATERTVLVAGDELDAALAGASDEPVPLDRPAGGSMLYTSGTTGRPKGVKRSRQGTLETALATSALAGPGLGLDGGGPHLVTGPLYHASHLGFSTIDFNNGAPLILMRKWDPASMLRLIEEHQVRNTHLVPIMFVRALRLPDEVREAFDPSSLHTVLHGAAPVSPPVKARMIEWWGDVIVEYWGSTEGGVFTLVGARDWMTKPGTVGRAIPTYEVFAVDDQGRRLPPGEIGTLYTRNVRTADVFEYHGDREKTDRAHLEPGVFTMGDVGFVDEDGYVFLSDRAADMIISGGVNIYPAETEACLIEHPAVRDVAVFGVPDEEWGEAVKAAVELAEGHEPGPELEAALIAYARERLAGYKVPRSIDFEAELPRHPTGKLYKRLLRDAYWKDRERAI
jgi:long-chain acyl-CoA synthetase